MAWLSKEILKYGSDDNQLLKVGSTSNCLLSLDSKLFYNSDDKKITFSEGPGGETIGHFLERALDKIESTEDGMYQLAKVKKYLEEGNSLTIEFRNGQGTSYVSNAPTATIGLDLSEAGIEKATFSSGELDVLMKPRGIITGKGAQAVVQIEQKPAPFHIVLSHELNHLIHHRIDGSNTNRKRSEVKDEQDQKDNSRINKQNVFENAEEHRNVFSIVGNASEARLRPQLGQDMRYPYKSEGSFLEPVKTVLRNAVKSERYIEGTTLPPLSVEGWVRRLVDLRDRLDALPSASLPSFTATTLPSRKPSSSSFSSSSPSSNTMTPSSNGHLTASTDFADASAVMFQPISGSTKIKLLPYLLNGDYSSIPNEYKEQMLQAQAQKREPKGKPTPWNDSGVRTETTEGRFSMMMDTIRREQDAKIKMRQIFARRYPEIDSKYLDIPGILAKEIAYDRLVVRNPFNVPHSELLQSSSSSSSSSSVSSEPLSFPAIPRNRAMLEGRIFEILESVLNERKQESERPAVSLTSPLQESHSSSFTSSLNFIHHRERQTTITSSSLSSSSPHMESEYDLSNATRAFAPMPEPSSARSLSSVSSSASPFPSCQLSTSSSSAQPPVVQPRSPLQTVPLLRPRPIMPGLAYLSQPSVASSAFALPIQRTLSAPPAFFRRG